LAVTDKSENLIEDAFDMLLLKLLLLIIHYICFVKHQEKDLILEAGLMQAWL
jgi:hypothetical protein